jgi:hypothetical protein
VHVHALEDANDASTLSAHAVFPRSGLYKIWVQVQRRGVVVTIPFVLHIGAPRRDISPTPTHDPSASRAHHGHGPRDLEHRSRT